MASGFSLDGTMIPRSVKRLFDQRGEPRVELAAQPARLAWRGRTIDVTLANLSPSGAKVIFEGVPTIGERVRLRLSDGRTVSGSVTWVRDGRIGVHFAAPLE